MGPSMIVDGDTRGALSRTAPTSPRFNGAVDDRRRRLMIRLWLSTQPHASMGPSMIVDGDTSPLRTPPGSSECFNGAVDDRRRRPGGGRRRRALAFMLQW